MQGDITYHATDKNGKLQGMVLVHVAVEQVFVRRRFKHPFGTAYMLRVEGTSVRIQNTMSSRESTVSEYEL